MPSPDLIPYLNLTLVDMNPQDLFEKSIAQLQRDLGEEYQPREGQIEVLLLEAKAEIDAELIYAINRLPNSIVEALLRLFGHTRDIGAPPVVDIAFHMSTNQPVTIPVDTSVIIPDPSGLGFITFRLQEDLVVPENTSIATGLAVADRYTSVLNGYPVGTPTEMIESLIYVDYAETASVVRDGIDPEDDQVYMNRGVQRLQRLSSALLLPQHFVAGALDFSYVERAFALDMYNPANDVDGNGPVGNDPGHMTVALYGERQNLTTDQKDEIAEFFDRMSQANLITHIIDPVVTTFDIEASVTLVPDADATSVVADIKTALRAFFDPMTWPWGNTIRKNAIITIISSIVGVNYVASVDSPATDTELPSVANLVQVDNITISIVSE